MNIYTFNRNDKKATSIRNIVLLIAFLSLLGLSGMMTTTAVAGYSRHSLRTSSFGIVDKEISLGEADASFIGEAAGRDIGKNIDIIGDFNGDGYDDVVMCSHEDIGGDAIGYAHIFFGNENGLENNMNVSDANITINEDPNCVGSSLKVRSAGDVNGDGFSDILVLTASYNNYQGQSHLFFGNNSAFPNQMDLGDANATYLGEQQQDSSGVYAAGVGDVNNDTYDDFIIGAVDYDATPNNNEGKVYLILGKESGWTMNTDLSEANASFVGEQQGNNLGSKLFKGIGDVNGDGFDDILLTSREHNDYRGKAYLIFGRESGWEHDVNVSDVNASFIGEASHDGLGVAANIVGDINGDGFADIIIGASGNDEITDRSGKAYIILGRSSSWTTNSPVDTEVSMSIVGSKRDHGVGVSLTLLGDVNNDTYNDILIGASEEGHSYLYLGKMSEWTGTQSVDASADAIFIEENDGDLEDGDIEGGGDINGDGKHDIFIGAPQNDDGGSDAGKAYLFFDFSVSILPLLLTPQEETTIDVWLPVIITVPIVGAAGMIAVIVIYMRRKGV